MEGGGIVGVYVLIGALAALGFLCALWAIFGHWLGGKTRFVALCFCKTAYAAFCAAARWRWLCSMGLASGSLLIIDCGLAEDEKQALRSFDNGIVFCQPSDLTAKLELERNDFD